MRFNENIKANIKNALRIKCDEISIVCDENDTVEQITTLINNA